MRILECFSFYRKIRCLCKQILLRHEVVQLNVFSWQSWQFPLRSATKEWLKCHLRGEGCKTRESAVSGTKKKMPSLQQRADGLYWLELTTAYVLNAQSKSR